MTSEKVLKKRKWQNAHYKKHRLKILKRVKKYATENRDKVLLAKKVYYRKNKTTFRIKDLKKKYNLSIEEYSDLFVKQSGVCAICGKYQKHKNLAVDHDHKTGKIRGLLCSKCNTGLGQFKDDEKLLTNAIKYINA